MKNYFLLLIILTCFSCEFISEKKSQISDEPIARVADQYLYENDLPAPLKTGESNIDSINFVRSNIDRWIKQQLVLNKAKSFLEEKNSEIERKALEYKHALTISAYEQELVKKNLDTTVSKVQSETYYESAKSNFLLHRNMIKVSYLVFENDIQEADSVKHWLKTLESSDSLSLTEFGFHYAQKFNIKGQWFEEEKFLDFIPDLSNKVLSELSTGDLKSVKDSLNTYIFKVTDRSFKGEVAPLASVKQDIEQIIVNRRKLDYLKALRQKAYNEALNDDLIEIYGSN